jgi:geranyl-CoA carboxylase beta subunit
LAVFFRNLAQMSAMGLPTMVVLARWLDGGWRLHAGMSDYVIGVKENGMAALGWCGAGESGHRRGRQ